MKAIASRTHFIQAICYSLPTPPSRGGWGGGADVEPSQGWEEVPLPHKQAAIVPEPCPGRRTLGSTPCMADSSREPRRCPRGH